MEREVLMEDLKKLYSSSDMVKADCGGCKGCHDCCCGMGDSIVLDPYDIYQMNKHLGVKFEELLNHKISLHAEEGLILPNLKMQGKEDITFQFSSLNTANCILNLIDETIFRFLIYKMLF